MAGTINTAVTTRARVVSNGLLIAIEFLRAENRLLKERLCGKRIRLTDAERTFLSQGQDCGAQSPDIWSTP